MIYCLYEFEAGKLLHTTALMHLIQRVVWSTALCDLSPTINNHDNRGKGDKYSNESIWIVIEKDKKCMSTSLMWLLTPPLWPSSNNIHYSSLSPAEVTGRFHFEDLHFCHSNVPPCGHISKPAPPGMFKICQCRMSLGPNKATASRVKAHRHLHPRGAKVTLVFC